MKKSFVSFDKFERECMKSGKSLHETMQENCNDRLAPPEEKCPNSCVPYWQATGEQRCLDIGVVEIEEADGCGHTRFTRVSNPIAWTDIGNTRCDESNNRIQKQQMNQCGDTRWLTTNVLCCTPEWTNTNENDCSQSMERVLQEDGCGHTRWYSSSNPVNWVSTGEVRCEPGNVYQIEQVNQCGTTRWLTVAGGCPCIPNWQPLGSERCTGDFVENQESDGCGHTRWQPTSTAVVWSNTGETRCNGGFIQNQQISQCGTTRWLTTETTCTTSPAANELSSKYVSDSLSSDGKKFMSCRLSAVTGAISWGQGNNDGFTDGGEHSEAWVTGAFDRNHYEARISYTADEVEGGTRIRAGSTLNTWFDLGDTSEITHTMTCTQPGFPVPTAAVVEWHNILIRIDIRKKGESISGGCTFGPFLLRAD